jgi:hypothetical protein
MRREVLLYTVFVAVLHGAPCFWPRSDPDEILQGRFGEAEEIISFPDCADYGFAPGVFVMLSLPLYFHLLALSSSCMLHAL